MNTTIEKLKRLEKYLSKNASYSDPVIEKTIDKLLDYEKQNIVKHKNELLAECKKFESQYSMKSEDFSKQFDNGELGDKMDFIEWSSTIDMLKSAEERIKLLETNTN